MKSTLLPRLGPVAAPTGLALLPATGIAAPKPGNDFLSLNGTLSGCTFTVTVQWSGFQQANFLEVFVTDGFAGTPIGATDVRIQNRDSTMTVTLPPLAD